jgi:hypothetical protein
MSEGPPRDGARLPLAAIERQDAICDRFEAAWRAGRPPSLEELLEGVPQPERPALLAELLRLDVFYRQQAGEQPAAEDYRRRLPDHVELVEAFFAGLTLASGPSVPPVGPGAPDVPGYEVLEELGRGGMGVVYQARQLSLNRVVALKMILAGGHADPAALARFKTEPEAIARLQHPNIVQVYEVGEHGGLPFFSMEHCSGGSLAKKLAGTPQPPREAARLVEVLARTMHAAHQTNVLHRDLKPANVLLSGDGTPKIADFGLAKLLGEAGKTHTEVAGTPSYMAPEQAAGRGKEVGPATDVYALGAVLYECLTGRPPFKGASLYETLEQVMLHEPAGVRQLQPGVPRDLETICLKCLQKQPGKRYASALELAEDLQRFQAGKPIVARPVGAVERAGKWVRRNPTVSALAAAVLLVLLGGVAVSSYFAYAAGQEAKAARAAEEQAEAKAKAEEDAKGLARAREVEAQKARADAEVKAEARRAEDARHAILIQEALRAREERDYERMGQLLTETRPEYHDAWETRHVRNLWLRHAFPLRSFVGPTGPVYSVAFSPDGRRALTGSSGRTARLWDARTGQLLAALRGHTKEVTSVAFSPDGTRALTGSWDKTARLWDARAGQEMATLKGHAGSVYSVALSPDGGSALTGSTDGTARLWDARTGKELATLKGHVGPVDCVAFSPDGRRALTGSRDKTARLWDARTGQELTALKGHTGPVDCVAYSPDGTRALTGSADKTARLWDPRTGKELAALQGHTGAVASVAFSPDGKQALTGSHDGTARLWDVSTDRPARPPKQAGR